MIKIKKLVADKFKQLKELEIVFPARGSFLIEGLNESGKSTLFEAIYFGLFGEALVTEAGTRRALVDLIDYHSKYAYLELQVEVRERILTISRTINRDSSNQWKLEIGDEEITKNNPVNERLMLELGLDGDALLNSCFVEQKKLEKLEGLTKPEREKSLMKLLNLDRLLELEYKFKVKREEEKDLQSKQQKLEWAKLKNIDLPKIMDEKNKTDFKLEIINLLKLNQKIDDEKINIKRLVKSINLLQPQKVEKELKVQRLEELKKTQNYLEKLGFNLTQIKEQETEIEAIKKQIEELDALSEKIPAKEKLITDILILGKRLARINKLEDNLKLEKENIISLDKELGQVEKVKSNIAVEEAKQKQKEGHLNSLMDKENVLGQRLKLINEKEALENWRWAKHTLEGIEVINQKEKEIQTQKTIKEEEKNKARSLYKKKLFAGLGLLTISVIISLLGGSGIIGLIMWLITLLIVGIGVIYIKKTRDIIHRLVLKLRELEDEILRLEGQRQSTKVQQSHHLGEQDETRLVEYEAQLLKLNLPLPEGIHEADTLITNLSAGLEGVISEEIKENYSKITREIAGLQGAIASSKGIIENYKNESNYLNEPKILQDKERAVLRRDKLIQIINKFKPKLQQKVKGLDLVLDRERLLGEYNKLKTEVKRDFQDTSKKDQLLQKVAERNSIINNFTSEMNTIYASTTQISRGLTLKDYERLKNKILGEIKMLQEETTFHELKDLQSKIDAYRGEISLREKTLKALEVETQKFSHKAVKSLKYTSVRLQDEAELLKQKEDVEAKIGYLKTHLDKLCRELHLENVTLEVAACEKEVIDLEQALKIRTYAEQILSNARNNMVAKVLPNTIRNMQKILPLLTCDRYHDAEITDDYKIRVWDERAMRLCAKNIFSGGTKDQFSLALRIAFAISTLPEERGISPSFIFLDEPLSSFDVERSQALIYLLTKGEIMQAFDQIFVISHSQILDQSLFNYYIKMDNGKITEHNLG
ncbi:MAG: SMC family ATPase [bacterium]|nr:SMC family ATPase [bacterium]